MDEHGGTLRPAKFQTILSAVIHTKDTPLKEHLVMCVCVICHVLPGCDPALYHKVPNT